MEPLLPLDIRLPRPDSRQRLRSLHHQLRAAIADRRLQPGLRLPATRAFAEAHGVSRNTVVAAYELLIAEGYLLTRHGAGTFVADTLPRQKLRAHRRPAAAAPAEADKRLQPFWRDRRIMQSDHRVAGLRYDFRLGIPEHREFPFEVWRRLTTRATRALQRESLSYDSPQGRPALREAIAAQVSFSRAVACRADDVIVTGGAQQAFDLLARILVAPGRSVVAIEDPGYRPMRMAFAAAGARIVPVPVDHEGLCVDRLPADAKVVCVTPSHQFPLGSMLSARRRAELLAFAHSRNIAVIEDDYDGEFRYAEHPLDALKTLDRHESVFYVGTFSKSLFPAVRLGYVVAPAWAQQALASAKQCSDWHNSLLVQDVVAAFLAEGHMLRHVRRMRRVYEARSRVLVESLRRELGDRLVPFPPAAGLHLAAMCSPGVDADAIAARARAQGIALQSLSRAWAVPPEHSALGFGFGAIEAQQIGPAIRRLAKLIEQ